MENKETKFPPFGKKELMVLTTFLISNFLQSVIFSINGPLYPPEAESKGLSPAMYSLVLSFYRVVMLVFGIILGIHVHKIGLKRSFVLGVFLNGLSPLCFGFLHYVDSYGVFLGLSFLFRGLESLGAITFLCSMYMTLTILFPGRVAMGLGILQCFILLGSSIGPLLGSLIDSEYGFPATYASFGILQMFCSGIAMYSIPTEICADQAQMGIKDLVHGYLGILKLPSVGIYIYACAVAGALPDFISAILEPDLRQFHLSEVEVGFMFFLLAIPQLASPLWGFAIDRMQRPEMIVFGGSCIMVLGLIFLGPFPGIIPAYGLTVAGLILCGLAQGSMFVSSLGNLRLEIIRQGVKESMVSISFVSIGFLTATSLGAAIGPIVAGVLFDSFGFSQATLFLFAIHLILGVSVLGHIVFQHFVKKEILVSEDETEVDERKLLLIR